MDTDGYKTIIALHIYFSAGPALSLIDRPLVKSSDKVRENAEPTLGNG